MAVNSGGRNNLDGQGMQTLIDEILHCIIHKPMAGHATLSGKGRAGDTDAKVRAEAFCVGACMARVGSAFVKHFARAGVQEFLKASTNCFCGDSGGHVDVNAQGCGGASSDFM